MSFISVKYTINGKTYVIDRPTQAREIPLKSNSERGFIPSIKPITRELISGSPLLDPLVLNHESIKEHDFLLILDHDWNCIDLQPQPIEINYLSRDENFYQLYPDIWAVFFVQGRFEQYLFEVKTEKELLKLLNNEEWKRKVECIKEKCRKFGWEYRIITEKKINSVRLDNIKNV